LAHVFSDEAWRFRMINPFLYRRVGVMTDLAFAFGRFGDGCCSSCDLLNIFSTGHPGSADDFTLARRFLV